MFTIRVWEGSLPAGFLQYSAEALSLSLSVSLYIYIYIYIVCIEVVVENKSPQKLVCTQLPLMLPLLLQGSRKLNTSAHSSACTGPHWIEQTKNNLKARSIGLQLG